MVKRLTYAALALTLVSCNVDWLGFVSPTSDTTNKRVEQSLAWNEQNGYKTLRVPTDNYRFYVGSDVHVEKTTRNLDKWTCALRNDTNAYFGIIAGDCVNEPKAFHVFAPALRFDPATQKRNDTIFTTLGNHDLYFEQWDDYKSYFGTATYWFEVQTPTQKDLFIGLDTGNGTLGTTQFDWLRDLLAARRDAYRHCIVFTHTNLFKNDNSTFPTSEMALEETFKITDLMQKYRVDVYLQGHDHNQETVVYRDVEYVIVPTMRDDQPNPRYVLGACGDKVSYEFLKLD